MLVRNSFIAALTLLTLGPPPARAEVLTSKAGQVSIDVPSGWKSAGKGDVLTIADPTGEVAVLFFVVEKGDLKKAGDYLDAQLAKTATDIKWADKPKQLTVDGMPGLALDGTCAVNGKPVKMGAVFLATPAKKGLVVLAMVDADKHDAHKAEIKSLFGSLKQAK